MNSFLALSPLMLLTAGALLVLLLEVFLKRDNRQYLGYISLFILLLSGALSVYAWNRGYSYFNGMLNLDQLSLLLYLVLAAATFLVILISLKFLNLQNIPCREYYPLILFALSGMLIMISSSDLIVIFLGLEVLSISSYALAGIKRKDPLSSEAAGKYFLLGSFASAFIVFGLAFLFGAFQTTNITGILGGFSGIEGKAPAALAGLALLIAGFGFKIAVVPFHMWTPDVYQGAPTPITAFFSIGPKVAGFAVLIRLFHFFLLDGQAYRDIIFSVLWVMAALTMIWANLAALRQTNIKRILAYSSIAHAGYLLVALLAGDISGLIFYLIVYLFMNIGAFTAVTAMAGKDKEYLELEDYSGVGFKYPWLGASLSVFLFSLAGFPPTGGFLAKFTIFASAVDQGLHALVIIAVLTSLISVFYYLRIIVFMYMKQSERDLSLFTENPALFFVLFICLYGVLQLGLFPGNILVFIRQAAASLALF